MTYYHEPKLPFSVFRFNFTVEKPVKLPQYSVFSTVMSRVRLHALLERLNNIIDSGEDDIRCYVLPADVDCKTIGKQIFPDDVLLFAKGVNQIFG